MSRPYRMRQVFVPGGLPQHTYVPRSRLNLEEQLRTASDNLCKLVAVTGPTKCGKSVLAQTIYPKAKAVWIDGGTIRHEDDLWLEVANKLEAYTQYTSTASNETVAGVGGEVSGQLGLPWLAKIVGKVSPSYAKKRTQSEARTRSIPVRSQAIESLRRTGRPLIVDDFHYLPQEIQGGIVRSLNGLIFEGHAVILLAIPHRRYDAIRVEKEMTGRVHQIQIPYWTEDELKMIPLLGFPLLNVTVDDGVLHGFAVQAIGSPHLMQEFCRQLCVDNRIEEGRSEVSHVSPVRSIDHLYRGIAADTGKTIFDRLAKGPRQRSDRTQRQFRDGSQADIYVAVLRAIAKLQPGMSTVEYEQIRSALRELLVDLPQVHEVSRVLEHMGRIQSMDATSAPVLEWEKDERRLHIIDPYFAFFLRWGVGVSNHD